MIRDGLVFVTAIDRPRRERPLADAERVYRLFESGDLGALSDGGQPIRSRSLKADYGDVESYGLGSATSDETLFVLAAHDGPSYLPAVDASTGESRWKADRPAASAWTTPIVASWSGGDHVVVSISPGPHPSSSTKTKTTGTTSTCSAPATVQSTGATSPVTCRKMTS